MSLDLSLGILVGAFNGMVDCLVYISWTVVVTSCLVSLILRLAIAEKKEYLKKGKEHSK